MEFQLEGRQKQEQKNVKPAGSPPPSALLAGAFREGETASRCAGLQWKGLQGMSRCDSVHRGGAPALVRLWRDLARTPPEGRGQHCRWATDAKRELQNLSIPQPESCA